MASSKKVAESSKTDETEPFVHPKNNEGCQDTFWRYINEAVSQSRQLTIWQDFVGQERIATITFYWEWAAMIVAYLVGWH